MSLRSSRMYAAAVPTMPPGLVELMEGLAKDVLKNSPDNIYEFCAQHMKKLIEIRDGKAHKNDSPSVKKMSRDQEKDREKTEISQKLHDTEMVEVKTNDRAYTNEKESGEKQILQFDENSLIDNHESEKEVEIEKKKFQIEGDKEKDREKTEIIQKLQDTEMVEVKTNDRAYTNEKECGEKQIPQFDENSLIDNHESEKEVEIEKRQFQIEGDTFDSNNTITVESVNDDNATLPLEISSEIKEEILYTPKSLNENSIDKSLSNQNLVSSFSDKEIGDIIKPIVCTTNIENENTPTDETNLLKTIFVSKDENQQQPIKSFDSATNLQSADQTILENNKDNLVPINDLDNANSSQKDSSENEVVLNEPNHDLESSITELSIKNGDCLEVINHQAMDGLSVEDRLHLQKSNETEESAGERSSDVDNEAVNYMDLEKAAITIQKVFRAFLFKSKTLSTDEVTNIDLNYIVENEENEVAKENKERRSGISRMDTVLQTVNEEKSLSLSTEDSSTLSSAATIIQAHVRGFLVRCKLPFNKTISTASVLDSDIPSPISFDSDQNQQPNKTILNIHIVPEGNNFMSRDESLITSLDLSLDGSPRHSSNLHPLGYDRNERRKQLKREDAVQSVTPPSNNSGKLSEEVDSVKEIALNDSTDEPSLEASEKKNDSKKDDDLSEFKTHESETRLEESKINFKEMKNITSDEADVVTPFTTDGPSVDSINSTSKLLHSGEFHDIVLPTIVSRNNSSVVREFQNVLVYFLLWNPS